MSFVLNAIQLGVLNNNTHIAEAARHILTSNNHAAKRFREVTGITSTDSPNRQEIQRAITYLRSQRADVALVARVINLYLLSIRR